MKGRWKVALAALGGLALVASAQPLRAQDASPFSKQTTLWVDQKTGEVFVRPGRGREPMTFGVSAEQIVIYKKYMPNKSQACMDKLDQFFQQWWETSYTGSPQAGNRPSLTGPGLAGGDPAALALRHR